MTENPALTYVDRAKAVLHAQVTQLLDMHPNDEGVFHEALDGIKAALEDVNTAFLAHTRERQIMLMYCRSCNHPKGYHTPERGCSMPLDGYGMPASSTRGTASTCRCDFENAYPSDQ